MANMIMGIVAALLAITGAIILASAGCSCEGFVRTRAMIAEITRGEAHGYIKPIVMLDIGGETRRAVCGEMKRHKLNAERGDVVDVIYKPRGQNGFSAIYVDQTGDALKSRAAAMKFAGILLLVLAVVFGVLAVVI